MTELISRDIPIFCIVASRDEVQSTTAATTRDVWTKRFGFTNWNWHGRIDRGSQMEAELLNYNEHLLKTANFMLSIKQYAEVFRFLDLMDIFKKIIANNLDHAIIIEYNTSLRYDIPNSYAQKDISFLSMNENGEIGPAAGLIVSKDYATAYVDFAIKKFFVNDFTLREFFIECLNPGNRPYQHFIGFKANCTSNIDDLLVKTAEEMHTVGI